MICRLNLYTEIFHIVNFKNMVLAIFEPKLLVCFKHMCVFLLSFLVIFVSHILEMFIW